MRISVSYFIQVSNAKEVTDVHDVSASFSRIFEMLLLVKFGNTAVDVKAAARLIVSNTDDKVVTVTATVDTDEYVFNSYNKPIESLQGSVLESCSSDIVGRSDHTIMRSFELSP